MGTRLGTGGHAAGGRRPPGGAWAGPGAHCDMGPAWVPEGFSPPSATGTFYAVNANTTTDAAREPQKGGIMSIMLGSAL